MHESLEVGRTLYPSFPDGEAGSGHNSGRPEGQSYKPEPILVPQRQVPPSLCPQRAVMDDWTLPGPPVPSLIWGHGSMVLFAQGHRVFSNIPL